MRRTKDEIDELRREAAVLLQKATRAYMLRPLAQRKLTALQEAASAVIAYTAAEQGVDLDELSLSDALPSDDEKALVRLIAIAGAQAGSQPEIPATDTLDHAVARLAAERGWSITDAARAILGNADARVDDVRNTGPHGTARRVRTAVQQAIRERLARVEEQLSALRGGRPIDATPVLFVAAAMSFVLGREIPFDTLEPMLESERDRLAKLLRG